MNERTLHEQYETDARNIMKDLSLEPIEVCQDWASIVSDGNKLEQIMNYVKHLDLARLTLYIQRDLIELTIESARDRFQSDSDGDWWGEWASLYATFKDAKAFDLVAGFYEEECFGDDPVALEFVRKLSERAGRRGQNPTEEVE